MMESILQIARYLMISAATLLAAYAVEAEANTLGNSAILDRKDSNEWYIFIPSTIQVDDFKAGEMLRSQNEYWRSVESEIRGLEGESAALRAVDALNEMLAQGIGFEMELGRDAYVLNMYYHQNGRTVRWGMRLPALLTDYNLPELLNIEPKTDHAASAAIISYSFTEGDCD